MRVASNDSQVLTIVSKKEKASAPDVIHVQQVTIVDSDPVWQHQQWQGAPSSLSGSFKRFLRMNH